MKSVKMPIVTHFLDWSNGYPQLATQERFKIPFAATASSFSFLSSLFHGIVLLNYDTYTADLRKGINKFRWWEYAVSSSVMMALLALLFGV